MIDVYTPQYVCFKRTEGEIFSIGPNIEEGYEYIEITQQQALPFQELTENIVFWKVVYNKRNKQFELKKSVVDSDFEFPFVELPNVVDDKHDIEFIIDKQQKVCYIKTNDIEHNSDKTINFTVTKKNDPHILYNTFEFELDDEVRIPFFTSDPISVYCKNKFLDCAVREIQ